MAEYTSSYTGVQIDAAIQKANDAVSYSANQGLTATQKTNARNNIGAGTSNLGAPSGAPGTLGTAAFRGVASAISSGGTDLVASGVAQSYLGDIEKRETRVVAKYNVTDTSNPTKILYDNLSRISFSALEIDGVAQQGTTETYTFSTTGEHTAKFTLADPTTLGDGTNSFAFSDTPVISVYIPNSVTSIGNCAFELCYDLTSIIIPNSVISPIGESTFSQCSNLAFVKIGDNVTSIDENAFYECPSLTSVTIPNSVTSIGGHAFQGCSSLTSLTIPNSVTSIGIYAFYNCSGLTSVNIPNGVTSISGYTFEGCSGLTSVTIPNSVTSIKNRAFFYCENLMSLVIGSGLSSTGKFSFSGCGGLVTIVVDSGNSTFDSRNNCNALIKTATNSIVRGCENTIIPSTVTSIGERAFNDCHGLTSIVIPNGVTSIDNGAFSVCDRLVSINIPDSVTSIGSTAFQWCDRASSVSIGSGITSIGTSAFENCSGLTSFTISATTPPTLGSNALTNTNNCPIYVPSASVNTYKSATNWSSHASRIQAIP